MSTARLAMMVAFGAFMLLLSACGAGEGSPESSSSDPGSTTSQSSTASAPESVPTSGAPEAYLIVSDLPEEHLYVIAMPSGEIIETFDHVELVAHTGVITLPDGRVLFADGHDDVLRVLDLQAEGGPALVASAPLASGQAWSAVDPAFRYYAGSSRTETEAIVDVVDLETMEAAQLRLPVTESGETHVALGGTPLSAFVWAAGTLYAYPVEAIMAGTATDPTATFETGPGAHSQVLSLEDDILWTSLPDELLGVRIEGNTFGETLTIPWNVDGREGGRVGRMRLSYDGRHIYGALAASVPAEGWVNRENDVHVADLGGLLAKRMPLHLGITGRAAIAEPYAFFYSIHPEGDEAILVDTDDSSATFQQIVARIPLTPLASGPVVGESASGTNLRGGTITPDGRWAFVSNGGEGTISVISTAERAVISTITLPTPLAGGGLLVAWNPGAPLVDLLGR
ncbi:MAG: hypothetical protein WD942_04245 [Dehalococcoidia bacterium]